MRIFFSCKRLWAIIVKEFIQMRRDRLTFAIIIIIPLMQLLLFGYAINMRPTNLPTVIINSDNSPFTRAFIYGLKNTKYFNIVSEVQNEHDAERMLATWKTQFVINIPPDFTRQLLRGKNPRLLVEADATDAVATSSALAAVQILAQKIFNPLLRGNYQYLQTGKVAPINLITHANYNPEAITQYNIVPGLLGLILTMTMVVIASMCITREREKGTIENLLATPVRPLEVMIGKITPFIIIGYIQIFLILVAAKFLFNVPTHGSILLLIAVSFLFIVANLSMGVTFSSLSKTQLQSSQMAIFFFLPSILLSGFMFPFRGMPMWAQYVGNILPLTHYLRIVRGILLKGNDIVEIWSDLWPIITFMIIAMIIGLKRFRQTLD